MFDIEREQLRKTYQLCRLGFMVLAISYVLFSFDSLLTLFGRFEQGPGLLSWIHGSTWYQWVGAPITWGSLVGAILLWGRWDHVSWQRRAGVFLLMNMVDVILWIMERGDAMGVRVGEFGHEWLRMNLGNALAWGEFALLSSLTCDYLVHLGVDYARDSDKSTRSMAATGAMLWLLLLCQTTVWRWPLQGHHARGLEGLLLTHGFLLIRTITGIQVTALLISAVRQSTFVLQEMDREDEDNDLLRSRSDSHNPFEIATSQRDDGRYST